MTAIEKILQQILGARADNNLRFDDLCRVLRSLGFTESTKGSHHIFSMDGVVEIVNLQPLPGGRAKAYQVKQVRQVVTKYRLGGGEQQQGDER